jgi:hypothetical protein
MPPVRIEDGVAELALPCQRGAKIWNLRKVLLVIEPEPGQPEVAGSGVAFGRHVSQGQPLAARKDFRPARMRPPSPGFCVRGTLQGDHFENLDLQAGVHPRDGRWEIRGSLTGLRFAPALVDALPDCWRPILADAPSVRGQVALKFQASGAEQPKAPPRFSVTGVLSDGEIVDARLPYRLYDVQAEWSCDNQHLKIDRLTARNGATTLQVALQRAGFAKDSPLTLHVQARQLALERRIVEFLPADGQMLWRKYFPAGLINADVHLAFDGQRWQPEVRLEALDASFEYHKFPYRVEHARGSVVLRDNRLDIDLRVPMSGREIRLCGEFTNPGEAATGYLDVSGEGVIPLDEKLVAAVVDPKVQASIRALHPSGTLKVINGHFERREPGEAGFHKTVEVQVQNGAMQYDGFPYPVNTIQGTLLWNDGGWVFKNLSGCHGSGYIECQGDWQPVADGGSQLVLHLLGTDIPLEGELRDALQPGARRLWADLRPRGSVDHLKADVTYTTASRQLTLDVWAQKWKKRSGDEGRNITLHPMWFPYRWDDVTGAVHFRDGQVSLQNVAAVHGETEISVQGGCRFDSSGGWMLHLTDLVTERLRFDREFLAALPQGLGKAVGKLNLQGAVNVEGGLTLAGVAGSEQRPTINWDLIFDVENGGLRSGLQADHIHGDVRLFGTSDAQGFFSRGELNLDSLIYKDVQLTQVRGPVWIDATRLVFGSAVRAAEPAQPPRAVTANVLGGVLAADATLEFDGDMPFSFEGRLERGDLTRIAQELAWKNRNIRGRANGVLRLKGTSLGPHSWRGNGFVRLYEADIYEIPVMLALLKLLSIRRPDTTAFTSSDIDFRIQGEVAYFDRINFNGDVLSLRGRGEMNLDRQIALSFYTLVGHGELPAPVLKALLRQASKQLLLIHVAGTLDEPQMTREALPLLKETLDQIFPELANRQPLQLLPPR